LAVVPLTASPRVAARIASYDWPPALTVMARTPAAPTANVCTSVAQAVRAVSS
jgi:hypothetical protein